jgi:prophage antirepressor-like protein
MSTLVDLYNGLLKYDNNDIVIVIDDNNLIWFYGRQVAQILKYKNTIEIIKRLGSNNKTTYIDIKDYSHYKYNIQDHAIFINESAMYELTFKSRMLDAMRFKEWMTSEVIPTIRKTGSYLIDAKSKKKMEEVNKKLSTYKKRVKILENNQKKERYPEGGYVYVIQAPDNDKKKYKIGKTNKNLNLRLNTYNTTLPDKVFVVYKKKVKKPIAVEHCLKGLLYEYRYTNRKEYYKISLKHIIKMINDCDALINGNKTIKRTTIQSKKSDSANESDDILYGVFATDDAIKQIGGTDLNNQKLNTQNEIYVQLYHKNKVNYFILSNLKNKI